MFKELDARKPVVGNTDYPVKANALIDDLKNAANLPGLPFSFNEDTTAGLTLGFFGGQLSVNGVLTTIADGTVALTGSNTNYVEHTAAGVVSKNTTGFSADKFPIAAVVCDAGSITGYTDRRNINSMLMPGMLSVSVAGGAGTTVLTAAQWSNDILHFTGALTGNRIIEVPTAVSRPKVISNATSGAFTLTVKTNAGTGKAVTQGKRAGVYCDGTNVELAVDDATGVGAAASGAVTGSGLTMATARLVGRTTASTGAPEEISVGSGLALSGGSLTASATARTRQVLTSGTGATYTRPAGCVAIHVRMVGGGGGGSGATANAGAAGGNTTFSTLTAGGGGGGVLAATQTPSVGGSASGGDVNMVGTGGAGGAQNGLGFNPPGGSGGTSALGGAGGSAPNYSAPAAATNSGSGGAGGGGSSSSSGGGGASGGYVEKLIVSPSATYTYTVGAGGAGGIAGGTGGGAGAAGIIIVDEYYQ